jgi:hypothetical protein
MRQLGYTDPEIYHFEHRNGFNSPIYEAYDRLRKDTQFAGRIAAAPSFDETAATSESRPPNDLEYLYGMFAIDANDSSVCGKISPNAARQSVNHQAIPLRLECFHDLAYNNRDPELCEKLPARSNLPPGARDDDSREACFRGVDIVQREPVSKAYQGPGLPPSVESFQAALHDIGYDVDLPRPTYSDYEDFLQYLANHDRAGRAEFLRRVAALK